jgi:peptide/nickel transport system substrate-binding protein
MQDKLKRKVVMDNQNPDNQFNNKPNIPEPSPPPGQTEPPQQPVAPQPNVPQVISNNQKPKKRKLKALIIILILALIGFGAWYLYDKRNKDQQTAPVTQSKDVDQLNIGLVLPDYDAIFPDISAATSYGNLINAQMFEGLVRYENKSKIVPLLATDWTNPDDKTWVFNIKSGVKFHNGNEMQATDVKYSIDLIIKSKSDFADTFTSTIDSVKVLSDSKVQIKTNTPDPSLLNKLAVLYVIDANAPKDSEPSLAGTGPYQIRSGTKPTKTEVQMVAYDGYHGGKPTTRTVSFGSEKSDDALVKAFNEGKYDMVGSVPIDTANATPGATQFITSEPEVAFLGLNAVKSGPLAKKEVREAIRYAVDPIKLGESQGDKITPLSQLIPESIPGYNPAIPVYERDVAKAKQLLAKAGYPKGLSLKFTHSSDKDFSNELARELKEAGINLKIDYRTDFNEFIDFFLSGEAEMYYVVYASDTLDGLDIFQTTLPPSNYESAPLNKLLDEAGKTVDPARRLKLLQDAAVIVNDDVPVVPLSTRDSIWLMDNDYQITQDMPSSYLSVYLYKVQLK